MRRGGGAVATVLSIGLAFGIAGCGAGPAPETTASGATPSGGPTPGGTPSTADPSGVTSGSTSSGNSSAAGSASAGAGCTPAAVVARMGPAQQVGQLFMVGNPAGTVSPQLASWAGDYHLGNVMLTGRSTTPAAGIAADTGRIQTLTTSGGVGAFIATDQEGGTVQVLKGPGFDRMPTAVLQGGWGASTLQGKAAQWAAQLKAAGVNLNLAPVADVVAPGAKNPPIGDLDREFGHTPGIAGAGATAFARGQLSAGIAVSVKHFPGLGAVTANTDFARNVVDRTTTEDSPSVDSFRQVIAAGVPLVMVSSATYQQIDPDHLAVFSPTVIGWLRSGLGFRGAVISDDLSGAKAPQVLAPGPRAVAALSAGVDLLLISADPQILPAMWRAVSDKAAADAAFRQTVTAAATRVVAAKQRFGLVRCG